ncbi:molybdopterin-dependent oxidoreductase [Gottschalkiaceae bacterium SANA]|nr:molybdopterin-dependent oxidoreductase [Gottschalkiaceae bacterium SANA]
MKKWIGLGISLLVIAFFLFVNQDNSTPLETVEIQEYKGERLGSIEDFRENSIKGPQVVDIETYQLQITGLVETPLSLSYDEVLEKPLYEKVVQLNCVEGWSVRLLWEGVLMEDLIQEAKPMEEATHVIFYAVDGYATSIPLETILERKMLLAYKMNDTVLRPDRGYPFQLVAEDKLGYKWIKWVEKIELSDQADFRGYWEKRGYDNTADIGKPEGPWEEPEKAKD